MTPAPADALARALRLMMGSDVAVAAQAIGAPGADLAPAERAAIRQAVPARQAEFAAGRQAARRAMAGLGAPPRPIPMGPDRAPRWPLGITGSISHAGGLAMAAVALSPPIRALGLDIEPETPLEKALWPAILTEAEQKWLHEQPENDRGTLAKCLFSIKECSYKAQYVLTARLLEFHDLEVTLDRQKGHFSAVFQTAAPPFRAGHSLPGQVQLHHGLILSAMVI